ncbi:MAG TPA: hypothetical protein VGR37_14725 [Longimicrobiaceae bacterium]|nr:hypothetical protein [Longimicrobiaceae bacterium]
MGERGQERAGGRTSRWEWVAAAVGTLLVVGAVAFMLREALTGSSSPPAVKVTVDSIIAQEDGFLVQLRVENKGGETAAALLVEGELKSDTGTVEKSETTISYVPAKGRRSAGLFFKEDPRDYALRVRPRGYDRP